MARKGSVPNMMDHTAQVIFSGEYLICIPSEWANRERLLEKNLRLVTYKIEMIGLSQDAM
jgi:hypothetical protein